VAIMTNTLAFGVAALTLAGLAPHVPRAQDTVEPPVFACVLTHGRVNGTDPIRIVRSDERCRGNETRMRVIVSRATAFVAAPHLVAADTAPGGHEPIFVSTLIERAASLATRQPLLFDVTVVVDTDRALASTIVPTVGGTNPRAVGVTCAPAIDGLAAGAGQFVPLSRVVHDGGAVSAGRHDDFPDALSRAMNATRSAAPGSHRFAVVCESPTAVRFRGTVRLTVLQQLP
jgi:hypothetical protein